MQEIHVNSDGVQWEREEARGIGRERRGERGRTKEGKRGAVRPISTRDAKTRTVTIRKTQEKTIINRAY